MSQSFTFTVHIVPLLPAHTVRLFIYFEMFSFYQYIFYLKREKLEAILDDPTRSFNCDETFVLIFPVKKKVLATMGTKDVYFVHKTSAKSGVLVLSTISASGMIFPPIVVYPYERIQP